MKHLIVGAGRMGQKHGKILQELGEEVIYHDPLQGIYSNLDYLDVESILVCTPPETHYNAINDIWDVTKGNIPIFCEKPLITDSRPLSGHFKRSLTACNYRFNANLMNQDIESIYWSYPNPYPLDLIHFVDVIWERTSKPPQDLSQISIVNCDKKERKVNGNEVGLGDMFVDQMLHWLGIIKGSEKSINPFEKAFERTVWLIEKLNANQSLHGLEAKS